MSDMPMDILPEVAAALQAGQPVVALESTVIAHGMPRPQNLEIGRRLQLVVREQGVIPATVAVLGGRVKIGLSESELAQLAEGAGVLKVSRRDFPTAVARQLDGATTVAGTIMAAHWAGIRVLATGGIGGVHRGDRFDVSADLPELARTPVVVVCSGAKAILHLSATLEWLETHGVPVVGYGVDELPAFYSRSSGLAPDLRADSPLQVAALLQAQRRLRLSGGVVVAVAPPEQAALPGDEMKAAIEQALAQARLEGIRGKEITPFLLRQMEALTGGASLRANVALLENNAKVAAQIAAASAAAGG
jgi:pseudouridine-5'-phosphate glycosidase